MGRDYVDHGHTVLAIPVPALDAFVRARTAHYDAAYLAEDPAFGQAHVTVLGPWVREPSERDLALVASYAGSVEPFELTLAELGVFADGIIHLLADPPDRLACMTVELARRFPDHPPYGGRFADVVPHVTLDAVGPGVDVAQVREWLGALVPVTCRAEQRSCSGGRLVTVTCSAPGGSASMLVRGTSHEDPGDRWRALGQVPPRRAAALADVPAVTYVRGRADRGRRP
ncbi:2'-5' RNA ligase family protein [Aeromicrobium sp. UC242_57]|uniref:2'-5' RNA ligase family protein n=1 Tax=Aeromicrobium sp. UC242_57 TaxID=3374624 RepID=UPI0037B321FD